MRSARGTFPNHVQHEGQLTAPAHQAPARVTEGPFAVSRQATTKTSPEPPDGLAGHPADQSQFGESLGKTSLGLLMEDAMRSALRRMSVLIAVLVMASSLAPAQPAPPPDPQQPAYTPSELGPVYIHLVQRTVATRLMMAAKHLSVFS